LPVWNATTAGIITLAAAVAQDGSAVYVPSGDGLLYSLSTTDGAVLWTAPLSAASVPTVDGAGAAKELYKGHAFLH
jgi:outer membrane protein assembly factor BamB